MTKSTRVTFIIQHVILWHANVLNSGSEGNLRFFAPMFNKNPFELSSLKFETHRAWGTFRLN